MDLRDRLGSIGPKRILAIDGGGIRSLISLGFLEQIESLLREPDREKVPSHAPINRLLYRLPSDKEVLWHETERFTDISSIGKMEKYD